MAPSLTSLVRNSRGKAQQCVLTIPPRHSAADWSVRTAAPIHHITRAKLHFHNNNAYIGPTMCQALFKAVYTLIPTIIIISISTLQIRKHMDSVIFVSTNYRNSWFSLKRNHLNSELLSSKTSCKNLSSSYQTQLMASLFLTPYFFRFPNSWTVPSNQTHACSWLPLQNACSWKKPLILEECWE